VYSSPPEDRLLQLGAALLDGTADHRGRVRVGMHERMDQGQRRLAFREVVADILPELAGIALVVERVVDELEGDAEVPAIARESRLDGRRRPGNDRRDLRAGLEEARRLAVDHVQVPDLGRVRVAGVHELHDLAGGDGVGRVRHHADDRLGAECRHHLEGAGVEEVADQHRGGVAEGLVGRLTAPAPGGVVHDVIVQEGCGVDEFDEGRSRDMGRIRRPGRPGSEHDQERPKAFAAPADDVVPHLVHERDVACELAPDLGVDRREVAGDEGP